MRTTAEELELTNKEFEAFMETFPRFHSDEDRNKVRQAYQLATRILENRRNETNQPFILHNLELAKIASFDIGLGTTSVLCCLLFTCNSEYGISNEEIEKMFGHKVLYILNGLRKIPRDTYNNPVFKAETFRKLLLSLSDDVRVIFIRIADCLHLLRQLAQQHNPESQKIASETLTLYCPLAHRLGLSIVKTELEDVCFSILHPEIYQEISSQIKDSQKKRINYINRFVTPVIAAITNAGYSCDVNSRSKSIYSTWNKMQKQNIGLDEVFDLLAIRIIFDPKPGESEAVQCFKIYSIVTQGREYNPDRLRDWVTRPKDNGYEALHVTVRNPGGQWIEVQIRTRRMNDIAELGYAAHWKYKGIQAEESTMDLWIKKAKLVLENQDPKAMDFFDEFKLTDFTHEILVFTPKNEIITLPKRSTILDFAFAIHSNLGSKCIGAQIDSKIYPVNHVLQSGDTIKVLTAGNASPKEEWLNFVETDKARRFILNHFHLTNESTVAAGKRILLEKMEESSITPVTALFHQMFVAFDVKNKFDLYLKIGKEEIPMQEIEMVLAKYKKGNAENFWLKQLNNTAKLLGLHKRTDLERYPMVVQDLMDPSFVLGKCCQPHYGQDIVGLVISNSKVEVHLQTCPNALRYNSTDVEKKIDLLWQDSGVYIHLKLKIKGKNPVSVFSKIYQILDKKFNISLKSFHVEPAKDIFVGYVSFIAPNMKMAEETITNIKAISEIKSTERVMV